jgi:serine/threonine protein kinase
VPALLVDRYELQRRIGSGGMATVWIALDRRLQREVAVKILSDTLSGDDQFRERFEREARRVASLSHPNIVVIHDFGVDGDSLFIVMELVRGMPLRRALLSQPLTPEATRTVALGILSGLGHAHEAGILHRDIKPGNILLTESGSAKLADFGIAKSIDDTIGLTDSGAILGSVSYASPEQLAGNALSPASDLYSLSCVLYECLAGRPPFVADNLVTLIAHQQNEAPTPLGELAPSAPKALTDTIMQGLVKDPEHRFATTEEMQTTLSPSPDGARRPKDRPKRALRALPNPRGAIGPPSPLNVTTADTRGEPTRPWWRRSFVMIAAGIIFLGAAITVGALLIPSHTSSSNPVTISPAAPGYTPKLIAAKCPSAVSGMGVQCQSLIVPQDRSHPKGRRVKLLVVEAAARTPHPAPNPVLDLGSTDYSPSFTEAFEGPSSTARLYSNYIALSRRGGIGSSPALSCSQEHGAIVDSLALPSSDPQGPVAQVSAFASCRKKLLDSGIDPNDYGDDARAADVRDLVSALHLSQVNLLAADAETRVAYDVMREYPTIVRSVTLEDPLSPSVDPNMNSTNSLIAALSAYQSFCDRDPSCAKEFPNLEQEMNSDYTELEQHPGTVDVSAAGEKHPIPIQIDGDRVDIALDAALGSGILAPVASQIYRPSLDIGGLAISEIELGFGSGMPSFGALESQYCKDEFPNDDANDILSDEAADAASPAFAGFETDQLDRDECRAWGVAPDKPIDFRPVSSTIPTFISTGGVMSTFDYPAWAAQVASGLPNSTKLVFPTLVDASLNPIPGETPPPGCLASLRLAFLRNPFRHMDVKSCEAQSPAIDFGG